MHNYVSIVGFNRDPSEKKLNLMNDRISLALKKNKQHLKKKKTGSQPLTERN